MRFKLFSIANILTLINAFFGCCALVMLFSANYEYAFYCTLFSLVADFFDGFAARKFNSNSELGKQLDSLADAISFGVVPGVAVFMLLQGNSPLMPEELFTSYGLLFDSVKFLAFLIPLFSILRLAKFNLDERQSDHFIGLATPANTIFWMGYLALHNAHQYTFTGHIFLVVFLILMSSFLLIAEIPMFSFKFKNYQWKGNEVRYLFLLVSFALFLYFKVFAACMVVLLYIVLSLVIHMTKRKAPSSE